MYSIYPFLVFDIRHPLWLCLVPGKYKGKKKNAKENDFLMFACPMKNIKETCYDRLVDDALGKHH